jgi:uncharacterized small protein (DUF1192 family)
MAKTLVDQASSLIQKTRSQALARRQASADELKTLLLRNEEPQPGDEEKVVGLVQELGIKHADLPAIFKLVSDLEWAETVTKDSDEIGEDAYRKQLAFYQVDEWFNAEVKRLEAERKAKTEAAGAVLGRAKARENMLKVALGMSSQLGDVWKTIRDGVVSLFLSQAGVKDQDGAMEKLAELSERFDEQSRSYRRQR